MSGPVYPYRDRSKDHLGPWHCTPEEIALVAAFIRIGFEFTKRAVADNLYAQRFPAEAALLKRKAKRA